MDCKKEENKKNCACTYEHCSRKGICCECIAFHRARDEMPACYFTPDGEKEYDRSIAAFIKNYQDNKANRLYKKK